MTGFPEMIRREDHARLHEVALSRGWLPNTEARTVVPGPDETLTTVPDPYAYIRDGVEGLYFRYSDYLGFLTCVVRTYPTDDAPDAPPPVEAPMFDAPQCEVFGARHPLPTHLDFAVEGTQRERVENFLTGVWERDALAALTMDVGCSPEGQLGLAVAYLTQQVDNYRALLDGDSRRELLAQIAEIRATLRNPATPG